MLKCEKCGTNCESKIAIFKDALEADENCDYNEEAITNKLDSFFNYMDIKCKENSCAKDAIGFEEWFADQFSVWASRQDAKATNEVQSFISRLIENYQDTCKILRTPK